MIFVIINDSKDIFSKNILNIKSRYFCQDSITKHNNIVIIGFFIVQIPNNLTTPCDLETIPPFNQDSFYDHYYGLVNRQSFVYGCVSSLFQIKLLCSRSVSCSRLSFGFNTFSTCNSSSFRCRTPTLSCFWIWFRRTNHKFNYIVSQYTCKLLSAQ